MSAKIMGISGWGLTIALAGNLMFVSPAVDRVVRENSPPGYHKETVNLTWRGSRVSALEDTDRVRSETAATEDRKRFQQVMDYAIKAKLHDRSMGDIMQAIADRFIGTPYAAGLLDQTKDEKLVVSLQGFDCVLFVETVLAIAQGIVVESYDYPTFVRHIQDQRYRDGQLNGYCSRLHYFSDWIFDNQKRGNVANITGRLGGIPLQKTLNFMSQHRSSYPQLKNNNNNYQCILETETRLQRLNIDYIPYNRISSQYNQLQPGDIVAVATEISGLDVTHTGLVYKMPDGNIGFIHASPNGVVRIAPDLQSYVGRVEKAIGIIVARPIDPRLEAR